jgi:hypothetical protein
MKRFLFLILLLIPCLGNAQWQDTRMTIPTISGGDGSVVPYCVTCPYIAGGADVLCETPDGSADGLCGWAITETGGATGDVNFAASPDNSPALGCADIPMTYAATFTKTDTNEANMYAVATVSATANYVQFYIKINATGLAWGESFSVFALSTATLGPSVWLLVIQNSEALDDLRFFVYYHLLAGWVSLANCDSTINLDTWYGIRLKVLDPEGGGSDSVQWWIDYNNDGVFNDEQTVEGLTLDRPIENAVFGVVSPQSGYNETHAYTITGIKIDDDTMPNGCAR